MFETLIFFGVVVLTQITKKYIVPKWGATGLHIFTFALALVGVGIYQYATANPEFMEVLLYALNYLALAVAVYEIILKKLGVKSTEEKLAEDNR